MQTSRDSSVSAPLRAFVCKKIMLCQKWRRPSRPVARYYAWPFGLLVYKSERLAAKRQEDETGMAKEARVHREDTLFRKQATQMWYFLFFLTWHWGRQYIWSAS